MIKRNFYLLIISLVFSSCNESTSNVDLESNSNKGSSYGLLRQVSYLNAKSDEKDILDAIKNKCLSEESGLAILSGDDTDLDGLLEYSEAETTSILCNGTNGQIVADTSEIFKDKIFEQCNNYNGLAFSVAFDSNHDNQLDAKEITADNFRVICETKNAMFSIKHNNINGYSTLEIKSGTSTETMNFYYPIMEQIPQSDTSRCNGQGGIDILLYGDNEDNLSNPVIKIDHKTICNGSNPIVTPIEGNITLAKDDNNTNEKCQITGGFEINITKFPPSYVCNGKEGTFKQELNLTIQKKDNKLYIYNNNESVGESLDILIPNKTYIKKKSSTNVCPFGELNISTYVDSNLNDKPEFAEIKSSEIICSAEKVSGLALKVSSAILKKDTNLTIDFKFNRPINQLSVNNNSVLFVCSSQSEKNIDVPIIIDFKINMNTDGVQDFNLTYSKAILPQPTNDVDCQLKISKFVEDTNGVSMHSRFLDDFNFTVQ